MQRFSSGVTGLAAGFKGRKWILPQSTQRASSQREQALNPWKPYRSYSPGIPNNPWSSTSKASSHRPGSPWHSPFPSHSTMCESFYSACDASGQTPLFIFRSMGSHPMGPRHQNFSTFPGHTTFHAREFHGPDSTLNCAGHLKEAPGPSQKPQQPRGPHSTNTSCRDTQSSYWDKLAQQSPSVPPFPAAGWDHPKLRLCCGPMARHGGSATAPQGPLGGHMEPMAGALSHMGHSLAFAPTARAAPLGAGAGSGEGSSPTGTQSLLACPGTGRIWGSSLLPQLYLSHSYPALQTGSCTEVVTDPRLFLAPFLVLPKLVFISGEPFEGAQEASQAQGQVLFIQHQEASPLHCWDAEN